MKKAFDDSFMPPPIPKKQSSTEDLPTVIPDSDITLLPKTTSSTASSHMPAMMNSNVDVLPVHKLNPIVGIASEISNIIGTVTSCISAISVEKQRTAQVRAQADAFKTQQFEMTKRTRIEQKEETKRLKISLKSELEKLKTTLMVEEKRLQKEIVEIQQNYSLEENRWKKTEETIEALLDYQRTLIYQQNKLMEFGNFDSNLHQSIVSITNQLQALVQKY